MASGSETQALVLHGIHDLRLETRALESPRPDEVQISLRATGLCGSDLHYYHHYRNGDIIVREPLSLGHESAGIVTAVGSNVSSLSVGDSVALEVGLPCSSNDCEYCSDAPEIRTTSEAFRYNLCPKMRFRSSAKANPHFQGTLQQKINHPAKWCYKLPPNVSSELGALIEPLSVAIHAAHRSQLVQTPSTNVLVFGAGAVGLLCAFMARRNGATSVVIADIDAGRVKFAVAEGFADAGHVVPRSTKRPQDMTTEEKLELAQTTAQNIKSVSVPFSKAESTFGSPGIVFECTGTEICVQTSIYAAKAGGKVMLVGMGTPIQTLPLSAAALREVDLLGVFRYADTYEEGIRIVTEVARGSIQGKATDNTVQMTDRSKVLPDLRKLITHRYTGFDSAQKAFEMAGKTVDDQGNLVLKVIIGLE